MRPLVLGLLVAVGSLSVAVAGNQAPPAAPVLPDLVRVKDNLYVIEGTNPRPDRAFFTGGTIGVLVTDAGVVLVDTKLANYGSQILDRIRKVTDKPVITVINTHTHGDHTGSNEAFPAPVEIVAHESTLTNMAKLPAFAGDKAHFLPKRTFQDRLSLVRGTDRIELYYFGRGHTNGDAFIYYPAQRVLQTGDMWQWRDAPSLDVNNGGSGVEFPQTLAKALATLRDVDVVIPGHAGLTTLASLEEFQRFTADLLAAAQSGFKTGQTSDQVAASVATSLAGQYPGYRFDVVKPAIDAIYGELKK